MSTATRSTPALVAGIGHIALNTSDLDRFARFYGGVLGLRQVMDARMDHPPFMRHAMFSVDDLLLIHVFEVPGYDPAADGLTGDIGHRGRIDHFGFAVADREALDAVTARLVEAGASDGTVQSFGCILSVYAEDPDGLAFEVTCPGDDPESDPLMDLDAVRRMVAASARLRPTSVGA